MLTRYSYVLEKHFANYEWQTAGDSYDEVSDDFHGGLISGIRWYSINSIPKPSKEELDALWNSKYKNEFEGAPNKEKAQKLLSESDWAVLPDVGLTIECVQAWQNYRSVLRSIRSNPSIDAVFPEKPEIIYA
jgi:hypothetical protein